MNRKTGLEHLTCDELAQQAHEAEDADDDLLMIAVDDEVSRRDRGDKWSMTRRAFEDSYRHQAGLRAASKKRK